MAISSDFKFGSPTDKNKRADYLDCLTDIILSSQLMAEDLGTLEYLENEQCKKRCISRIEELKVKLNILSQNL